VQRPKVRDRLANTDPAAKVRFTSNILPKWARRSVSLDALWPVLYLKGTSTGDFQEALAAILAADAPNLSPGVVSRLTAGRQAEYDTWTRRDLSARHTVYIWADGVYLQVRMEETAECMLVIIGATPEGKKELTGFQVGLRESAQSWHELLSAIKARGLAITPKIAVGPSRRCKQRLPGYGWCHGVLECAGQGVSKHNASALLPSRPIKSCCKHAFVVLQARLWRDASTPLA